MNDITWWLEYEAVIFWWTFHYRRLYIQRMGVFLEFLPIRTSVHGNYCEIWVYSPKEPILVPQGSSSKYIYKMGPNNIVLRGNVIRSRGCQFRMPSSYLWSMWKRSCSKYIHKVATRVTLSYPFHSYVAVGFPTVLTRSVEIGQAAGNLEITRGKFKTGLNAGRCTFAPNVSHSISLRQLSVVCVFLFLWSNVVFSATHNSCFTLVTCTHSASLLPRIAPNGE